MRVGSLEIEILAGLARLQKDMNDAQRIVGGSMANVEKSVASAKQAMQALGVGLPLIGIIDQVRRMTDQYTKLDAQLRLSTKTQAQYTQGLVDLRRISATAQSDINATSMLYTRLMQVTDGMGVSQSKIATITETVSYGLKAYGATAQEAASASLQLSQAMGANRLGGEEFRAVMEAMPNVMKVLANSMGVPLGELRALSIAGKITAEEMVKAFGDPAIAAQFKAMALNTQTVTGAWVVARNELMLLVGEFGKSSGGVNIFIGAFKATGETFALMAQYMQQLVSLATIMAVLFAGRYVAALQASWAMMRAHTEALAIDAAGEKAHAAVVAQAKVAEVAATTEAATAKKLAATISKQASADVALAANAEAAAVAASSAVIKKAAVETAAVVKAAKAPYSLGDNLGMGQQSLLTKQYAEAEAQRTAIVAAANTERMAIAEAAVAREGVLNAARIAQSEAFIAAKQVEAIAMNNAYEAQRAEAIAMNAAFDARAAATLSTWGKLKAFAVSNALGLVGLALWGAYEIADHMGWIDKVFNAAATKIKSLQTLAGDNPIFIDALKRADEVIAKAAAAKATLEEAAKLGVNVSVSATNAELIKATDAAIAQLRGAVTIRGGTYQKDLARLIELRKQLEIPIKNNEVAKSLVEIDHDLLFVAKRWEELQAQFAKGDLNNAQLAEGIKKMYADLLPKTEKLTVAERQYVALNKQLDEHGAILAADAQQAEKLSLTQTMALKIMADLQNGTLKLSQDEKIAMTGKLEGVLLQDQANLADAAALKAKDELQKQLATGQVAYEDYWTSVATSTEKLIEQAKQQEFENTLIGKTKDEIATLTKLRENGTIKLMEETLATMKKRGATTQEIADYEALIAAKKRVQAADVDKTVIEAQNAARAEQVAAEKKRWEMIDGFAHNAFDNILDKGKNVFSEIGNAIKKYVLDMLYKMTVQKWLINVGILGGGTGAAGSAMAGGMGSAAGIGASIMGQSAAFMGGISGAMSMGVVDGFMAGVPLLTSGLTGGISAGLGLMMPAIGLVGTGIALLSKWLGGNGGTPGTNVGAAYTGYSSTGAVTSQGSWTGLSPATNQAGVQKFTDTMNTSYRTAAASLGITAASTIFSLSQNLGKDSKAPQFAIRGGAEGGAQYFSGWTPQSDAAMQLAASRAVFAALQGSDLPAYMSSLFSGLTADTASQAQIDGVLAFAGSLKTLRDGLMETRTPLEMLTETVAAGFATLGTSAATFKTDFVAAIDAGISPDQLNGWIALGNSIDQLATVDAQKAADLFSLMSGINYDVATFGMSAFDKGMYDINKRLAESLQKAKELGASEADLARIREWGAQQASQLVASSVVAVQDTQAAQQAYAQQQTTWHDQMAAAQDRYAQGMIASAAAVKQAQISALQGMIGFGKSIKDYLLGLEIGVNATTPQSGLNAAREQYIADLAKSRQGDAEAYARITQDAQAYIDAAKGMYGSGDATSAILAQIKSELGGLSVVSKYDENTAALKALTEVIQVAAGGNRRSGVVPGFASGGDFAGGFRLVGENGPELEATGPSRIFNASQTRSMFAANDGSTNEELRAIRAELAETRATLARLLERGNATVERQTGTLGAAITGAGDRTAKATMNAALIAAVN